MAAPAPSFRDPDATLKFADDRVLRVVNAAAAPGFAAMLTHPFIGQLMADGRLVRTEIAHGVAAPSDAAGSVVYEHERVPFISYPFEWSPLMLARAAELTAMLCIELLQHGFLLKDATPANVLFRATHPIWVDVPSIVPRPRGTYLWNAQDQFERCFLLPLIASLEAGLPVEWSLRNPARGLDHVFVARLLGARRWLKPSLLGTVALPALAQRAARPAPAASLATLANDERARFTLERVFARNLARVRSLQRALEPKRSMWREYTHTRSHYGQADLDQKTAFIHDAVDATRPKWVLDVGANTGEFSEHAAAQGAAVVAVDTDEAAVNGIFGSASRRDANVLPMVGNFASPTPALGWANSETLSFLDRAERRFDLVLLLAVVHHLRATFGIPVEQILATVARVTRTYVVVEHVPVEDPMFQQLSRGRDPLYEDCAREAFERLLCRYFVVMKAHLLPNGRTLYLAATRS
jgi:SAM-dependent methyltransferase